MAGMPPSLIERANEILAQLEEKNVDENNGEQAGEPKRNSAIGEKVKNLNNPKLQLSIFDAHSATFEEIRDLLDSVDINRLTPVEALLKLQEIKNKVK
jgi:DNA mismatch repair protein MutS